MSRATRFTTFWLFAVSAAGIVLIAASTTQARPAYSKAFIAKYEKVSEAKTARCAICHPKGKDKKSWNNYGVALGKLMGAENEKDTKKIVEALKKTEEQKSAVEGKTFGDLLKAGKLPASKD